MELLLELFKIIGIPESNGSGLGGTTFIDGPYVPKRGSGTIDEEANYRKIVDEIKSKKIKLEETK